MTRHHFDPLSFVFGVVFAAVAALALTGPWELHEVDLAWIGPGLLVLLGLTVLLTARSSSRSTDSSPKAPPLDHGPTGDAGAADTTDDADANEGGPAEGGTTWPR